MQSTPKRPAFAPDATPLEALVGLSRFYGADAEFVIAGGGNTSVKDAGRLYVKASGAALAGADESSFVAMDRSALDALLARDLPGEPAAREAEFKAAVYAARIDPQSALRPSVECVLHNLIPARLVVHTHPTWANMLACAEDAETLVEQVFGASVLYVPFVDPGWVLAKTLADALAAYVEREGREPAAILMQNHGLITFGETPDEVLDRTDAFLARVRRRAEGMTTHDPFGALTRIDAARARRLVDAIAPALRGLLGSDDALPIVTLDDCETVMQLVCGAEGSEAAAGGPLTPDQIVYCKAFPLWFDPQNDETPEALVPRLRVAVERHAAETRFAPKVVLVKGVGLFAAGDDLRRGRYCARGLS